MVRFFPAAVILSLRTLKNIPLREFLSMSIYQGLEAYFFKVKSLKPALSARTALYFFAFKRLFTLNEHFMPYFQVTNLKVNPTSNLRQTRFRAGFLYRF